MPIWDWLNSNAPAMQAISGFAAAAITAVTIPVLIQTRNAAAKAAHAADRAACAADKQAAAADAQVIASKAAVEVSQKQLRAAESQLIASLRPVIIFHWSGPAELSTFEVEDRILMIKNYSATGVALYIQVTLHLPGGIKRPLSLTTDVLGPGGECSVGGAQFEQKVASFTARYASGDGRLFRTDASRINGLELKQETQLAEPG